MTESVLIFRFLPYVPYVIGVIGAMLTSVLMYFGLATRLERRHFRLRMKEGWEDGKRDLVERTKSSKLELLLHQAKYPLGMNALKMNFVYLAILLLLFLNYMFFPALLIGQLKLTQFVIGLVVLVVFYPPIPYSPTRFLINRLIEYRQAKKNAELFSLYDMLVSEIEMMITTRVNIYSLLRSLQPYFKEINHDISIMLSDWQSASVGPDKAINRFAERIGTNEAKSLSTVLQTFDDNTRENLIDSLRGMEDLFVTSQIENNRRKNRMFLDVISMPVSVAHFCIGLNFVIVFIIMVMIIMGDSSIDL